MNEDYTVAVLKGIPIFCVNRLYSYNIDEHRTPFIKNQYRFEFENGFGASVVEFIDRNMSGGEHYELAVLHTGEIDTTIVYDTSIIDDIERGDEYYINELLDKIGALGKIETTPHTIK